MGNQEPSCETYAHGQAAGDKVPGMASSIEEWKSARLHLLDTFRVSKMVSVPDNLAGSGLQGCQVLSRATQGSTSWTREGMTENGTCWSQHLQGLLIRAEARGEPRALMVQLVGAKEAKTTTSAAGGEGHIKLTRADITPQEAGQGAPLGFRADLELPDDSALSSAFVGTPQDELSNCLKAFRWICSGGGPAPVLVLDQDQFRVFSYGLSAVPTHPDLGDLGPPGSPLRVKINEDELVVDDWVAWSEEAARCLDHHPGLQGIPWRGGNLSLEWLPTASQNLRQKLIGRSCDHKTPLGPPEAPVVAVALTSEVLLHIVQHHPNEGVRYAAYNYGLLKKWKLMCSCMDLVRKLRQAVAQDRGFPSYGAMLLQGSCVGSRPAALQFLQHLSGQLKQYNKDDMKDLKMLQKRQRGQVADIPAWSMDYYIQTAIRRSQDQTTWADFADYFTLTGVLQGMGRLLGRTLGVQLRLRQPDGRQWQQGDEGHWCEDAVPGALHLEVIDQDLGKVGVVLVDLHQDTAEYPFTSVLRHGGWYAPAGGTCAGFQVADKEFRPGVVVIRVRDPVGDHERGTLSSPFFLKCIFHEMGHALHHLLSSYHAASLHTSSSSCPTDIKEMPSHLMEHFTRDPASLHLLSRHYRLGHPLPPKDCTRMAHYMYTCCNFTSLELQDLTLSAIADQHLHDTTTSPTAEIYQALWSDCVGREETEDPGCLAGSLDRPLLEDLRNLESLGSVGGVKYAYVLSRVVAAAVWKRWLQNWPADTQHCPGEQVKRLLFAPGSRVTPQQLVVQLLGTDALLATADGTGWVVNLESEVYQDIDLLG